MHASIADACACLRNADHCHESERNQRVLRMGRDQPGSGHQHNFANMLGRFHAAVRIGGLCERKGAVD